MATEENDSPGVKALDDGTGDLLQQLCVSHNPVYMIQQVTHNCCLMMRPLIDVRMGRAWRPGVTGVRLPWLYGDLKVAATVLPQP